MAEPMVVCKNVSKQFRIPMHQQLTLRGRLLHPMQRSAMREFDALHDISFEVERGEFFGIVGRNGSGKSTLLKILAGIYRPDSGDLDVRGSLAPFIELGVGFNFELSARDNVYLNGALLGLSKKQLRERYDHIVEFAELEEFMELKLANFSSGMQVRLAFAIAVESKAEIMLIDEVLAVGDERFQRKCFDIFRARKEAGETVIFVSHDMGAIREFCDRVLLIEHGRMVECGDPRTVAATYVRLNMPERAQREHEFDQGWIGDVSIEPHEVAGDIPVVAQGAHARLTMRIRARRDVERPSYGFFVTDMRGKPLIATNTSYQRSTPPPLRNGEEVEVGFEFVNHLGAGNYLVIVTLEDQDDPEPIDVRRDILEFAVHSDDPTGAVFEVPHDITVATLQTG